jgi:hypothetical protein
MASSSSNKTRVVNQYGNRRIRARVLLSWSCRQANIKLAQDYKLCNIFASVAIQFNRGKTHAKANDSPVRC